MARDSALPPESFEEILAWLNSDRDVAAAMYLQLRDDLAKIFTMNRCSDPEWLTDETFDRVGKKVVDLRQTYEGDPRLYFYGVARNLIKEDLKKVKTQASLEDIDPRPQDTQFKEETADLREECLHRCLEELSADKRDLILNYYAKEKQAKIDHRAELAHRLNTSVETLRVRVHRIRNSLEKCIEQCLDRKAQRK
jgi:RNA polymerase sigma factor (sigma-70 family)